MVSNDSQELWEFAHAIYEPNDKRPIIRLMSVGPGERVRTAAERLALVDQYKVGRSADETEVARAFDEAFSVEAVTKKFFSEYLAIFRKLQDYLTGKKASRERIQWAHDYSLQFLNRIMFLYFLGKKGWLGDNRDFLNFYWEEYLNLNQGKQKTEFCKKWLPLLIFSAFNKNYARKDAPFLPIAVSHILEAAPYLNGGLFSITPLDQKNDNYGVSIPDDLFQDVLNFFNKFNFTISEDTPFNEEVAVDPEMIGRVYESLVNVESDPDILDKSGLSENSITAHDLKKAAGIVYTARTEIALMCRLAVTDYLANNLPNIPKTIIRSFVFAVDDSAKADADKKVASANADGRIDELLEKIRVCDPAVGSGSFLVGMLDLLSNLKSRLDTLLGRTRSAFEIKKKIAYQSLYGVDVMKWAVEVCELRLWLRLIVDADLDEEQRRKSPLLPNLSFNVRQGDSLVQKIGGFDLRHLVSCDIYAGSLGMRFREYWRKKDNYSAGGSKYTEAELRDEERNIFLDLLKRQEAAIESRVRNLTAEKDVVPLSFGKTAFQVREDEREFNQESERTKSLADFREKLKELKAVSQQIQKGNLPFVWENSFSEVFRGEDPGFDIVIGNPPYVAQELIADPLGETEDVKAEYKKKLADSVYFSWPEFFGFRKGKAGKHLNAQSDLYIYFYFIGLSLLKRNGAFCFISSNSWLDARFGAALQEFLLKQGEIKLILDNKYRRAFATAAINTVIVLLGRPERKLIRKQGRIRFVMFYVPFESVLDGDDLQSIDEADTLLSTDRYRVFPLEQAKMLSAGIEKSGDDGGLFDKDVYVGDKWGGKYLRAPDIYWRILDQGEDVLVPLCAVSEVKRGITTGVDEFFYLNAEQMSEWKIEKKFLCQVIKSPRECEGFVLEADKPKYMLFMCHESKERLKGTNALVYIKWGEKNDYHLRPTCSSRARWWDLGERRIPPIISPSSISEMHRVFRNSKLLANKRLYEIYPFEEAHTENIHLALNMTLTSLFLEVGSRTGLGEGLLDLTVYELADCPIINPKLLKVPQEVRREFVYRSLLGYKVELADARRRELDKSAFEILGLASEDIEKVYESVIDMISARIKKAASVTKRK